MASAGNANHVPGVGWMVPKWKASHVTIATPNDCAFRENAPSQFATINSKVPIVTESTFVCHLCKFTLIMISLCFRMEKVCVDDVCENPCSRIAPHLMVCDCPAIDPDTGFASDDRCQLCCYDFNVVGIFHTILRIIYKMCVYNMFALNYFSICFLFC